MPRPKSNAICHPDKINEAHGLCNTCYYRAWYAKNCERLKPLNRLKGNKAYWKNPDKYRKSATKSRSKLREEMIIAYGGYCACCNESEATFLTIEHKNRDGKQHREAVGNTPTCVYRDLKKRGWPKEDYELLCFNCNRASWEQGICPHRRAKLAADQKEKATI
jgi:hypothetical protein